MVGKSIFSRNFGTFAWVWFVLIYTIWHGWNHEENFQGKFLNSRDKMTKLNTNKAFDKSSWTSQFPLLIHQRMHWGRHAGLSFNPDGTREDSNAGDIFLFF